jgi:cysteine synthase
LGGLVITSTSEVTAEIEQGVKEAEVTQDVDVLVVGGGTAGKITGSNSDLLSVF